jgi:HD-GYP domain-containing protein (c-di-GMP phosphodiesterase class II)
MTSERSHSDTLVWEDALGEIKRGAGRQFDPYLVEKLLSIYEKQSVTTTRKNARR